MYTTKWDNVSNIPSKQAQFTAQMISTGVNPCFSPSPPPPATLTENWSSTLIESRLNAMNARVDLVESPSSGNRGIFISFPISLFLSFSISFSLAVFVFAAERKYTEKLSIHPEISLCRAYAAWIFNP